MKSVSGNYRDARVRFWYHKRPSCTWEREAECKIQTLLPLRFYPICIVDGSIRWILLGLHMLKAYV